jgi:hypothetical protein
MKSMKSGAENALHILLTQNKNTTQRYNNNWKDKMQFIKFESSHK